MRKTTKNFAKLKLNESICFICNIFHYLRWDTRKLNEPLESLLIDPIKTDDQIVSRSYGVNVLEYETTMPTKFMCGTDMGMVFVCNRKGKSPIEKINFRVSTESERNNKNCAIHIKFRI